MFKTIKIAAFIALAVTATPALSIKLREPAPRAHWECVPFAREVSGIQIYGNALTWWDQADGRYRRGNQPRVGAVLSFIPHGAMQLGHVATVSGIVDQRTLLVTHANWSPINGLRGQVERDVEVRDVSEAGDWSAVRVWFGPSAGLGSTAWPTHGFIYPSAAGAASAQAQVPKLSYASVAAWRSASTASSAPRPSGRLAYLSKLLPNLR
jgi:surface antigen